jgi:hypothetical protein
MNWNPWKFFATKAKLRRQTKFQPRANGPEGDSRPGTSLLTLT